MSTGALATSLRVKSSTRDKVAQYGRTHDLTADEVVLAGLKALEWEALRKRAQYEAARLSRDPEYLAEIAAVQADLHGHVMEDRAAG
jgi:hypothetical protein